MRQVLKNWADNDYKNDRELDLIPALYTKLRIEGYDFKNLGDKTTKTLAQNLALHTAFSQLLLEHDLHGHQVVRVAFPGQVNAAEFPAAQVGAHFEVAGTPIVPRGAKVNMLSRML